MPAALDNSALQDGAVTISPMPGARDASPQTEISFLGVPAREISAVSVLGSRTGVHTGRLEAYSQGDGASFLPTAPFAQGERVSVSAHLRRGARTLALSDRFAIATQDALKRTPEAVHPGSPTEAQAFHSRPDLHPPIVTVTASSPAVAPGDVLLAPYGGPGQAGPMILDQSGALVWFKPLPRYTSATNLRVQEYEGKPVLTWWQGEISEHGFGLGADVIADSTYADIAHVRAGNGELADLHEFQLTPSGTALLTAYDPIQCNLSALGGPSSGALTDGVFQEIDVRTGLVMYEWTSVDHVGLGESHERASTSSTHWPFDFFHINSLNLDPDGSLLLSARNTWAVYEIDLRSGRIVWRLGGRNSSFRQGPGTSTAWQHDARVLPDGSISIFDNGSSPSVHPQSRGIVVSLDRKRAKATLAVQLRHAPGLIAESQGNLQALPNGDWFLGWGQVPDLSELAPSGSLLFDAHLPVHDQSYRAFRFAWKGTPIDPPSFAFRSAQGGGGTVFATWNGATEVASWRVLAGSSPGALVPLAQASRNGFETSITLPASSTGPYLAVQALDSSGSVLGSSAALSEPGLGGG